jgi:hypothetical protein
MTPSATRRAVVLDFEIPIGEPVLMLGQPVSRSLYPLLPYIVTAKEINDCRLTAIISHHKVHGSINCRLPLYNTCIYLARFWKVAVM